VLITVALLVVIEIAQPRCIDAALTANIMSEEFGPKEAVVMC